MTLENAVRVFAGTMVLVSVILTVFVHSKCLSALILFKVLTRESALLLIF